MSDLIGLFLCTGFVGVLGIGGLLIALLVKKSSPNGALTQPDVVRIYELLGELRRAQQGIVERIALLEARGAAAYVPAAQAEPVTQPSIEYVSQYATQQPEPATVFAEMGTVPISESVSVSVSVSVSESESVSVSESVSESVSVSESESGSVSESVSGSSAITANVIERFLGVRAAAVLGAAVLVIAGLYFFKYSIERGLITPTFRVIVGSVVGAACIVVAELRLRRRYTILADALDGAGVAILYLTVWSAHVLFALISLKLATAFMIGITALCCVLAVQRKSLAIAVLGLLGGFATPYLLSTGEDRPIALFSYLAVLDVALLYVAKKRNWTVLAALGLAGTALYQALWIFMRMDGQHAILGVGILGVFAAIFVSAMSVQKERSTHQHIIQASALALPLLFSFYFTSGKLFAHSLIANGVLLCLLTSASLFIARREKAPWLAIGTSAAAVGVLGMAWLTASHHPTTQIPLLLITLSLVAIHQIAIESGVVRDGSEIERALPFDTMSLGVWPVLLVGMSLTDDRPVLPWCIAFVVLFALAVRNAFVTQRAWPLVAHGIGAAMGFFLVFLLHDKYTHRDPHFIVLLGVAFAVIAGCIALSMRAKEQIATALLRASATIAVGTIIGSLVEADSRTTTQPLLATLLALGIGLLLTAATRLRSSAWYTTTIVITSIVCTALSYVHDGRGPDLTAFVFLLWSTLVLTLWPNIATRRFDNRTFAHRVAALVPLAALPLALDVYHRLWPTWPKGAIPLLLATVSLSAMFRARSEREQTRTTETSFVWHAAIALALVSAAIPIQLEHEWITIAWAIEALALIAFWARVDNVGLKYAALALFAAVCVRLDANIFLLEYHPRSGAFVGGWLTYTYWVPVLCMIVGSVLLRRFEAARYRGIELGVYPKTRALGADALAIGALVTIFVWINLAINDAFGKETFITLTLERDSTRDLARSLAWAVYGVIVLGLGMRTRAMGLRVSSLVIVVLTALKVFLYDIPNLKDLYRVASLLGLSLTLLGISLAYQRFVFTKEKTPPRLNEAGL